MDALSAHEALKVWERGLHAGPVQRAMELLSMRFPGQSVDELANLSIGQRDAALLDLRLATFGCQLNGKVVCPNCGEVMELELDVKQLRTPAVAAPPDNIAVEVADYKLQMRLPNTFDLAEAAEQPSAEGGRQKLLERCIVSVSRACGEPATDLPEEVVAAATARMAEADPQADLKLNVTCCACNEKWEAVFDIVSFLWTEVEAWAGKLIHEVHTLASAYGWSEREILSLSPMRRQMYLEMVL
jgi:hypothetical protein